MADVLGIYVSGPEAVNSSRPVASNFAGARVKTTFENFATGSGGLTDGDILVGPRIDASTRVLKSSRLRSTALGASVVAKIGIRSPAIATADAAAAAACLGTGVSLATAGDRLLTIAAADEGKTLAQLAGLGDDFEGEVTLIVTLTGADPAADKNIVLELFHVDY